MNTPNRPHEELDADERELARVVRALPGNEPPPALDLRILKAAQDAVAVSPTKRRQRALWATSSAGSLWGIGTAAAAVLAFGISWQMFTRVPTANFPASSPARIAESDSRDRDATTVDFVRDESKLDQVATEETNQPMPKARSFPAPATASASAPDSAATRQLQAKPAATSPPQPFIDEHVAVATSAEDDAFRESAGARADSKSAAKSALAENAARDNAEPVDEPVLAKEAYAQSAPAAAAAPAPAAPPPMELERREQQSGYLKAEADTGLVGGVAAPAGQAAGGESLADARQRIRIDARLYPESWLLKIRSRLRHGDTAGARASLKLFVERYPHETVPDNLKPLLGE